MRWYFGKWEWFNAGDPHWRAPGGDHVGCLDLRSSSQAAQAGGVPSGTGLFCYASPKSDPLLLIDLGDNLDTNVNSIRKTVLRAELGLSPTTPLDNSARAILRQLMFDSSIYDSTGVTRWKPLCGALNQDVRLTVAGTEIFAERVTAAHPARAAAVAVFQSDYAAARVRGDTLTILRRWTGATMRKLYGIMDDSTAQLLLPDPYKGDGWALPQTSISDNFNRANESLDAGSWVEVTGNWEVFSNHAQLVAADVAYARHTTQLSTDDHKAKGTIIAINGTNGGLGVTARNSTDASPNHDMYVALADISNVLIYRKVVNGTITALDSNKTISISVPDDIEIEVNNSTMISRFNGVVQHNFTDTSLSGQLNCGLFARRVGDELDDFTADDLAVATRQQTLSLLGVGV